MSYERDQVKHIVEAALLSSQEPLAINKLIKLFPKDLAPSKSLIREALHELTQDYQGRSAEVKELASGFCLQVKPDYAEYLGRLWEEKPPRYTRATLETLALIAYRQPITRAEIEEIRGVAVSSHTIKSLMDRRWVKIIGHKEVPGRPALFATTAQFLDYFNLKSLTELPPLLELNDLANAEQVLAEQLAIDGLEPETVVESTEQQPDEQAIQALVDLAESIDAEQDVQADDEQLIEQDA